MYNERDFLIITNNPMVMQCMGKTKAIRFLEGKTYREVLIAVRDLVYAGHTLYTHPLSGSVKPDETPYKSVVVSKVPHTFDVEQAGIIADAILTFDKFSPKERKLAEKILEDFQLIDYTLLSGAIDFDAAAGLNNLSK